MTLWGAMVLWSYSSVTSQLSPRNEDRIPVEDWNYKFIIARYVQKIDLRWSKRDLRRRANQKRQWHSFFPTGEPMHEDQDLGWLLLLCQWLACQPASACFQLCQYGTCYDWCYKVRNFLFAVSIHQTLKRCWMSYNSGPPPTQWSESKESAQPAYVCNHNTLSYFLET